MFYDWHAFVQCGGTDINSASYVECPNILLGILHDVVKRFCTNPRDGKVPEVAHLIHLDQAQLVMDDVELNSHVLPHFPTEKQAAFKESFLEALQCSVLKNERVLYTSAWSNGIMRRVLLEVGSRFVAKSFLDHRGYIFEMDIHTIIDRVKDLDSLVITPSLKEEALLYKRIADYKRVCHFAGIPKRLGKIDEGAKKQQKGGAGKPGGEVSRVVKAMMTFRRCVGHADGESKVSQKDVPAELQSKVKLGSAVQGIAASKGKAEGMARYLATPAETSYLKPGEVAVIPQASPAFSAVLACCVAAVSEQGGVLCHIAICSRELHLPAVVGCGTKGKLTLQQLHGKRVRVHGDLGIVEVIEEVPALPPRISKVIAVIGGSGKLGSEIVISALNAGHTVKVLIRPSSIESYKSASSHLLSSGRLVVVEGEAMVQQDVDKIVQGSDAVMHAAGPRDYMNATNEVSQPTICLLSAMSRFNVPRCVVIGGITLMKKPGGGMWLHETFIPPYFHKVNNDMIVTKELLEKSEADYVYVCCGRFLPGKCLGLIYVYVRVTYLFGISNFLHNRMCHRHTSHRQ
jgi:putative NADH-flavin reductase/phosphohistidine swiveling domain-containing protein